MAKSAKIHLISNGDYRDSAGVVCWPKQEETLRGIKAAMSNDGLNLRIFTEYRSARSSAIPGISREGSRYLVDVRRTSTYEIQLRLEDPVEPSRSGTRRSIVFGSYCHIDRRPWVERFRVHIKSANANLPVDYWDDNRLIPGDPWREKIMAAISITKVAVLFVSPDFLASDFITTNELPRLLRAAQRDGAIILPVIVSPCSFLRNKSLSRFHAVNPDCKPLCAMSKVERDKLFDNLTDTVINALKSEHDCTKKRRAHDTPRGPALQLGS